MADRLNHLEDKEKAAKKLKRLASAGHKKAQKVQKGQETTKDPAGFQSICILGRHSRKPTGPRTASGGKSGGTYRNKRRTPNRQGTLTD